MPLQIYDTLSRKEKKFSSLKSNRINMFVCGPTVYDLSHLGHARTYLAYDIIVRYLRLKGYSVFYLMNITDVDDKIINKAAQQGRDPHLLAEEMTKKFYDDMIKLKITGINLYPKASEHIEEIISQITILQKKGYAYQVDGDIYYDITRFPEYGKLSRQQPDELIQHRIDPNPNKRNPGDFALWKSEKPGEPSWDSPWGKGRPGWHIEDTAITFTYFGGQYDIHGGALELIFPHHEAEIAQTEAITEKHMVNFWIHTGLLTIKGRKMSKSLKNFITIRDALTDYTPEILRIFFAMTHYRSPIDYDEKNIVQAVKFTNSLNRAYRETEDKLANSKENSTENKRYIQMINDFIAKFHDAMEDDFNTPKAISVIADFTNFVNKIDDKSSSKQILEAIINAYQQFNSVLGFLEMREEDKSELLQQLIKTMLEVRGMLRNKRHYKIADTIRERLETIGVIIEDSTNGTKWQIKN